MSDEWHKQAVKDLTAHIYLTTISCRVNILLDVYLFAFEGRNQQKFKQQLAEQHRYYLTN